MNACEMFYDPSKSVLQMLKNACECRCESYESAANERRMQSMGIHYLCRRDTKRIDLSAKGHHD